MVLVTAEFIARIYYDALRDATRSPVLRTICDQILQDERAHIKFQCQRVAMIRGNQLRLWMMCKNALYRGFFASACVVVWCDHHAVFKQSRLGFIRYMRSAFRVLNLALTEMQPRKTNASVKGGTAVPGHAPT